MNTKKRVLPALILSLFAAAGTCEAQGAQFSGGVYVFGDSLSDAGYYRPWLLSIGIPSSIVSQLGRFTTNPGPVWSELVTQFYGVTPGPSNAGGTIYAQGGARVALSPGITPPGQPERPISTQITEYLSTHGNAADPNALYTIWGGANDFFVQAATLQAGAITPAQFQANMLAVVPAEIQQVGRLYQAGARNVMVFANYDPSFTPAIAAADATTRGAFTQLAVGLNSSLFGGLAGAGLRVIPVDVFSLMNEIRATPAAFGFTNSTGVACGVSPLSGNASSQFCLPNTLVAADAATTYVFADASGHLTTGTNRIIAQFAESMIEGPTAYSLLAEAPLRTRNLHIQTLNDGLLTGRQSDVGKLAVFAAGAGGNFDVDSGMGNTGQESTNNAFSVGVTVRASEAVMLGLAYGRSRSSASFGESMGGFRTREDAVSLFGSLRMNGFYGTGVVSVGNIDFRDVHRDITLGPQVRVATSAPSGSNASAFFNAGYDFPLGRFTIGPTVSVTTQNVDVNGFDEAGAGAANLHIAGQKRRSEVWSGGVRASIELGAWTPWIRVTADKERRDDDRFVTATPMSLPTGNSYDILAYNGDTSFTTAAIGVRGWVTDRVSVSLSYFKVSGRSGIKEEGATGLVSVKF